MFHKHTWKVVDAQFSPPIDAAMDRTAQGAQAMRIVERTVQGFSTVTQRCGRCGWTESYVVLGKVDAGALLHG